MTNLDALRSTCNAICNTFYPDDPTLELMLFNESISSSESATPKNHEILKIAIELVLGFVESSRSENGISTSNDSDAVKRNIAKWCDKCGLDASEYTDIVSVENGSNLW